MMSNTDIRKYVKENIKGKYGKILGLALLTGLISGIITGMVDGLLGSSIDNAVLEAVITGLAAALTTPLTVGLYRAVLNIIENKEAKVDNLFDYFKDFTNLFILGLICEIALALINSVLSFIGMLLEFFYIGMLYLYIYNPSMKPMDIIKNGFAKMKNKFWDAFVLNLTYTWPAAVMIVVAILVLLIGGAANIVNVINAKNLFELFTDNIIILIIFIILLVAAFGYIIFITPYVNMAQTIFYTQIMKNGAAIQNSNTTSSQPLTGNAQPLNNQQATHMSFCPNCGSKVEGNFCTNCGNKVN